MAGVGLWGPAEAQGGGARQQCPAVTSPAGASWRLPVILDRHADVCQWYRIAMPCAPGVHSCPAFAAARPGAFAACLAQQHAAPCSMMAKLLVCCYVFPAGPPRPRAPGCSDAVGGCYSAAQSAKNSFVVGSTHGESAWLADCNCAQVDGIAGRRQTSLFTKRI